ncbi:hypothetical protein [Paenibacillus sp. IHB B 3084]|uniref:hypothetical protein n=1 Tax=Paenibacillus sp. IHB B 3084 TaxID=867076 RepID=UPI001CB8C367|nr:hypothetical protein [Paenibacillus sp. IHB B 3084]
MLQLGDEVERNHETYVITKREGQLIHGLMTWSYECALSAGLKVPKIYNRTIIGAAIEGKILEVSRNQVRLHLDMDDQQNPKDAQWFPYSAEGNQVWYLMPEKGVQVKLYFPSADEDDAMVIQSVRTKPSTVAAPSSHAVQGAVVESPAERHQRKTADPGVKSFANPQGKEISLGNSELSMSAQEGSLYISMNAHHGVSLNSTQHVQIQATGSRWFLSAGSSILLKGTNGLHLNTTTDTLDLEQEVNSVSSEIQLKASLHQYYPEPLLSDFEKQVAEKGIQSVLGARVKENVGSTLKGEWDAGVEFLSGVWDSVVDIADMGTMVMTPFVMPGNYTGKGFLERNETLEGIKHAGGYIAETVTFQKSGNELLNDGKKAWDGFTEPLVKKWNNFIPNPLTDTKQESYDAGYDSIKAVERGVDVITIVKGGVKLTKNLGKLGKEEASLSKGIKGVEEKNGGKGGAPGLFGDTAKADSALAKAGDGKFKTNAIRFPTNFESLGSYLQSVARKMNIRITKRSPILATAGGHYKFHDLGPDIPRSKAGAKITPERQKQIDALESGEYTGKSNKGTGKPLNVKPIEPRGESIQFEPFIKQELIAQQTYDRLRSTGLDMKEIEAFSKNTGLSLEEAVDLKKHLFLSEHVNLPDPIYGKYYYQGYFHPDYHIAYGWEKALKAELSPLEKTWFRQLADHELAESKMMQEGMPYRKIESWDPKRGLTGKPPNEGAHDLAPPPPKDYPDPDFKPDESLL